MSYLVLIAAFVLAFLIGPTIGAGVAIAFGQNSAPVWSLQVAFTLFLLGSLAWTFLLKDLPDSRTYKLLGLSGLGCFGIFLAFFQIDGTFAQTEPAVTVTKSGTPNLQAVMPSLTELVTSISWVVYGVGVVCAVTLIAFSLHQFRQRYI